MPNIAHINGLPPDQAKKMFLRCCGSQRWAEAMTAHRPYTSEKSLFETADNIWNVLLPADWLEAFAAHPRIGDFESLREKFASTANWSAGEQSGVVDANNEILQALADGNRAYENRFGYIFIVCATGKSASQLLAILTNRLSNSADDELLIAAQEQAKITALRLEKL